MPDNDQLSEIHRDIRELRDNMLDVVRSAAETNATVNGLVNRLYKDGEGGSIGKLFNLQTDTDKKVAEIDKAVSNQRAYALGIAAAATLFLHVIKGLVAKAFGINIP